MNQIENEDTAFFERIRETINLIGNQNKTAAQMGITVSSVARWYKGESDPSRTNLVKLARAAGVNVQWLATGEGSQYPQDNPPPPKIENKINEIPQDTAGNPINIHDFVFIPYYNVQASAGHGTWADDEEQNTSLAFRRDWLTMFVTRHFEQLSVISVKGDSMTGVLEDQDTILIDHTKTEPRDGLFALRIGNDIFVKRVQRLPSKLLVKSANTDYESFEIDLSKESDENVKIIGQVVWLGRKM